MKTLKPPFQVFVSLLCVHLPFAYGFKDGDAGYTDSADLELAKDIISLVTDTTVQSKCDGNVFVVSKECEDFIGLSLMSLSLWAPPITLVSFTGPSPFPENIRKLWTKFLGWDRRPCSLIFVCDLFHSITVEDYLDDINITFSFNATTDCEIGKVLQRYKYCNCYYYFSYLKVSNFLKCPMTCHEVYISYYAPDLSCSIYN